MSENENEIVLNGNPRLIGVDTTISMLLGDLELRRSGIAVELNAQIKTKSEFEKTVLKHGDKIEIVSLVGGG